MSSNQWQLVTLNYKGPPHVKHVKGKFIMTIFTFPYNPQANLLPSFINTSDHKRLRYFNIHWCKNKQWKIHTYPKFTIKQKTKRNKMFDENILGLYAFKSLKNPLCTKGWVLFLAINHAHTCSIMEETISSPSYFVKSLFIQVERTKKVPKKLF